MSLAQLVLPGDRIALAALPGIDASRTVIVGPGLRHLTTPSSSTTSPTTVAPTIAGQLHVDRRKNAVSVERTTGRYTPSLNDRVLGTVLRSTADAYLVLLAPFSPPALLPHLAFESATRKTRPVLPAGALVYARVASAPGDDSGLHMDPELDCVSAETGRADGMGPIGIVSVSSDKNKSGGGKEGGSDVDYTTSGMVYTVSLGMARRLLLPRSAADGGLVVLDELEAAGLTFETVVGRNGRVWVDGGSDDDKERNVRRAVMTVVTVGRALVETDEGALGVDEQRRLVRRLLAKMA